MSKKSRYEARPSLDDLKQEPKQQDGAVEDQDLEVFDPFLPTDALSALALHAFFDATTSAQRNAIFAAPALAVVVGVPSPAWGVHVAAMLQRRAAWRRVYETSGTGKKPNASTSGLDVAYHLSMGNRVLGVSHAPETLLPPTLVAAADHRVDITGLSTRALRMAIREVVGGRVPPVEPSAAAGLDITDVAAAIRAGTTPASCLARLKVARESASAGVRDLADVPLLADLHGYGAAKDWGMELCRDIDAWRRGELAWEKIRAAAVLAGPPGCGKTTFARSLARSAGLAFFPSSVGAWFSSGGYLHEVVKTVDALMSSARASAPALVFLDELDALPSRDGLDSRNSDYWAVVVTRVLELLDGATSGKAASRLVVVGATNHPDRLDPALVRPGRLDQVLPIDLPGPEDLAAILRQHLGEDLPGFDTTPLGRVARGATGAQAADFVRRARARARAEGRPLRSGDLVEVVCPPDDRTHDALWQVAVHESGHAVAMLVLEVGDLHSVSLVKSGHSEGHVGASMRAAGAVPRASVERFVAAMLAGRAAEEVILGEPMTGAGGSRASDLAIATRAVAGLHASAGLGGTLVHLAPPEELEHVILVDPILRERVARDLDRIYAVACDLIRSRRAAVMALADRVVATRFVGGAEARAIIRANPGAHPGPEPTEPVDG